jgi:translation initiation factor eIF-2B subunit epsilon
MEPNDDASGTAYGRVRHSARQSVMKSEELSSKHALQALLLAESFSTALAPTTSTRPKALLPLANTPLIDYALHFLRASGVQQVFVVCRTFAAEIAKHLESRNMPFLEVRTVLVGEQCCSVGDVFRHVDTLEIIRFVRSPARDPSLEKRLTPV